MAILGDGVETDGCINGGRAGTRTPDLLRVEQGRDLYHFHETQRILRSSVTVEDRGGPLNDRGLYTTRLPAGMWQPNSRSTLE